MREKQRENAALISEITTAFARVIDMKDSYTNGHSIRVAQIIAVADCFDAMYSDRPYRKRVNFDKAVSIIREISGTQLTPDVVEAFLRLVEKGKFRDPDDEGGGSTENIENIRK